jgi:hypothetical protein
LILADLAWGFFWDFYIMGFCEALLKDPIVAASQFLTAPYDAVQDAQYLLPRRVLSMTRS